MTSSDAFPRVLAPTSILGSLRTLDEASPLDGGAWCEMSGPEDGFVCEFEPGALVGATHLTFDAMLPGEQAAVFGIHLREGADGAEFICHFAFLNECQSRARLPLEALNQNRWLYDREGAWLKIITAGDRVDPAKVDRLTFRLWRTGDHPARLCMTPITAVATEPEKLTDPLLPRGPLLDELGQSTLADWPGKTADVAEMAARLREQLETADARQWPETFSRFGGCRTLRFDATGFFRTHHDGRRWWLVDPEGFAFWSAGQDCVRSSIEANAEGLGAALVWTPTAEAGFADTLSERRGQRMVDYLRANLIRAFGADAWKDKWATLALSMLRRIGFNTVANWSQWEIASAAGFPYVRPMAWPAPEGPKAPRVFRDFPDVFDPAFAAEAAAYASQLTDTADDPALIGYFLMNEPTWGFADMTPAEGMLYNCDGGATREALAAFCRERYADDAALAACWGEDVSFADLEAGRWSVPASPAAKVDLEAFSTVMVEKLFSMLTGACRVVDPNHLNLGARYFQVPPPWAMVGMGGFDVFSVNGYRERVDRNLAAACEAMNCPALIGEWHFGALDAGLPASGIGRVATQAERGKAYRIYVEDAAAQPWCVGTHHFTLYDQSALGRFDGENYNIGFVDICHKPYEPLADAARAAHERIYEIAAGAAEPFDDEPEYLPRLFY